MLTKKEIIRTNIFFVVSPSNRHFQLNKCFVQKSSLKWGKKSIFILDLQNARFYFEKSLNSELLLSSFSFFSRFPLRLARTKIKVI